MKGSVAARLNQENRHASSSRMIDIVPGNCGCF
jgi:hypothetical protein